MGFLRWRFNLEGGPQAIEGSREFTWVATDGQSGTVPQSSSWVLTLGISRSKGESLLPPPDPVVGIIDGPGEPLGHALLREAAALLQTNPRASLVMAVMVLEVGTKACIAEVAPDTHWLLESLQSPPTDQLLGSYLPTLTSPGPVVESRRWRVYRYSPLSELSFSTRRRYSSSGSHRAST